MIIKSLPRESSKDPQTHTHAPHHRQCTDLVNNHIQRFLARINCRIDGFHFKISSFKISSINN